MNDAQKDPNFMAGDDPIADVTLVPWLRALARWDLSLADYPNVSAWYQRLTAWPAVSRGFAMPDMPVQSKDAGVEADKGGDIRLARHGSITGFV